MTRTEEGKDYLEHRARFVKAIFDCMEKVVVKGEG